MSAMENSTAEQLWYTWSDVGLSTVHAGFRIRAASPGLTEIYSERVQSMDRHMRYVLPPGTDRFAITPDMAPVCLAFIRTNWNNEYILVHKNYAGEDGVGRLGNFFVHVIALGELSRYFSAEDAIWLWGSKIWETSGKEKDRRSNDLETIPLKILQREINTFQPNFAQVRQYLPFIIEAYLSRKNRSPLYLAAHDSAMIASLIAGLLNCLPPQLLAGLTFSTYEPDVTKASTEIVGTSWIATSGKEVESAQIFSPQFYREKLAVNCYTGEQSSLQEHPQIIYNSLAFDFATYATDCLVTDNVDQLYALLELAEKSQTLDVDMFLRMYYNEIANTESIVEADIEKYLADPYLRIDRLCNRNFRKRIIERAGINRQWNDNHLQPRLLALREQAQRESGAFSLGRVQNKSVDIFAHQAQTGSSSRQGPGKRSRNSATQTKKNQVTLAEALTLLAERAIPDIVEAMKKVGAWREAVPGQRGADNTERQDKTEIVVALLSLMDCCLVPQNSFEVWKQLFDEITRHPNGNALAFLTTHWGIFLWLLEKWDNVVPIHPDFDNAVRPLLIIPWSRLGEFLQLNLPQRRKQWNAFVVEKLIKDTALTPQVAQRLEQNYAKAINDLLAQLLQEAGFTNASYFAIRLIEKGYPVKSQFAALIERLLAQLMHDPQLWSYGKEIVVTLTRNNYVGTEPYLNLVETLLGSFLTNRQASMQANGAELVNILVEYGYPRKKRLFDLLLMSNPSQAYLESILERVYKTPEELNAFFINEGEHYLSTPDQVRAMVSLYQKLVQILPHTQKLERLFVFLDTSPDGNTILQLLTITPLEEYERAKVLERYGNSYLSTFQLMPQLAYKAVEWFIQLVNAGYPDRLKLLFALFTSATDYRLLENMLTSAQLSSKESQTFFRKYGLSPGYFPFFYFSATSLTLFSRLAQKANILAESGQADLAAEKMNLLFAWLGPSQSPPSYDVVEKFLRAAALRPAEQIYFLERYGEIYFSYYPKLPLLNEYISTFVNAFNANSLEQAETRNFFRFLTLKYQTLPLDTDIQNRIQWWMIIDKYFTSPSTHQDIFRSFVKALFTLGLPNDSGFNVRLAKAFASCVRNADDLNIIMQLMQQVPKIQTFQLLYIMAEQVTESFRQQKDLRLLLPYLSFVPNMPNITREQREHFTKEFFDTLLESIDVLSLDHWRALETFLAQQGISQEAQEQWHGYLKGLDLLERLQSIELMATSIAVSEAQSQKLPSTSVDDSKSFLGFKLSRKQLPAGGTRQPYQNPGRPSSGSLPGYNSSSLAEQAPTQPKRLRSKQPEPLVLGPYISDTQHGQQSQPPQSGVKFNIEEDSKGKKKRNQ